MRSGTASPSISPAADAGTPAAGGGGWRGRLAWLFVYAAAMGALEAICVVYLRVLFPPEAFQPIPPLEKLRIEVWREACTIVMLTAVAWLAGVNFRTRLASFLFAFGVWDAAYYAGLRLLLGWPASLLDWDCLFLIPKPWYGPILAPLLVSAYGVVAGVLAHAYEARGTPLRPSAGAVLLNLAAAAVWYWSFVRDSDRIAAGGFAGVSYAWPLFLAGMAAAAAGLRLAARPRPGGGPAAG